GYRREIVDVASVSGPIEVRFAAENLLLSMFEALSYTRSKFYDGMVAAMINVNTVARLNAGSISMKGVVYAVALGRIKLALVVGPTEEEQTFLDASGWFAFSFGNGIDDKRCLAQCNLLASVVAKSLWLQIRNVFGAEEDEMEIS
ncbi:hypothetical protein B0H19DRAFT_1138767, partial [Mycena capillaripes]